MKAETVKLIHGGDLQSAAMRYGIELEEWIDLSTGINPCAYPIPKLNEICFQQLPYLSTEFKKAVTFYYGSDRFAACSGSQQVIELLPKLLPKLPVLLPSLGYQEHSESWINACEDERDIHFYPATDQDVAIERIEFQLEQGEPFHLVVINPNNPTGLSFSVTQLFDWSSRLAEGGFLIVDEAFIDLHPEQSVLSHYDEFHTVDNLVVMRSFGKFFGLAGLRLGFLFGPEVVLQAVHNRIGIWSINGPAQAVAIDAFNNRTWQMNNRVNIRLNSERTLTLFSPLLKRIEAKMQGTSLLFSSWWVESEQLEQMYDFFAQRGVLLRVIEEGVALNKPSDLSLLRLGIIDAENESIVLKLQQVIDEFILTFD